MNNCFLTLRVQYGLKRRLEVLTTVMTSMLVFWVSTLYRLVGGYKRFGELYYLHLQG